MHLFIAGIYTSNFNRASQLYARLTDAEKWHRDNLDHLLESYHYVHKESYVNHMRRDGVKVFLDSGAFSAFTKGIDVDIKKYADYIKQNRDIIEQASVLDAIGDPRKTLDNQKTLEDLGVQVLPCFHYGEPEEYLEYYIENYDYITIGGMVPISSGQLRYWLDHIWHKFLTDKDGKPIHKVHGFGLTTLSLMTRYPWHSVDSSTWLQNAANGKILVADVSSKGFFIVDISDASPALKVETSNHIDNLPEMQRQVIIRKIEERGFEVDRLKTEYVSRWAYNAFFFCELGRKHVTERFVPEQPGLF